MAWTTERETVQRETQRQNQARVTWNTDVLVPAGQALLIAAGVAVGFSVPALALTLWRSWPFWIPIAAGSTTGSLAFALSIILLVLDHRRLLHTFYAIEQSLNRDLNQDGTIGDPNPPRPPLRIELHDRASNGNRLAFIDLPASDTQLITLATALLNGAGTSETEWTGAGNPFSRSEFAAVRSTLLDHGLATWTNPQAHAQGWQLTAPGRAVMRRIAQMTPTTLPHSPNPRTHQARGARARARVRTDHQEGRFCSKEKHQEETPCLN